MAWGRLVAFHFSYFFLNALELPHAGYISYPSLLFLSFRFSQLLLLQHDRVHPESCTDLRLILFSLGFTSSKPPYGRTTVHKVSRKKTTKMKTIHRFSTISNLTRSPHQRKLRHPISFHLPPIIDRPSVIPHLEVAQREILWLLCVPELRCEEEVAEVTEEADLFPWMIRMTKMGILPLISQRCHFLVLAGDDSLEPEKADRICDGGDEPCIRGTGMCA